MMGEKIIDLLWGHYKGQVRESEEELTFLSSPSTMLASGMDLASEKAHCRRDTNWSIRGVVNIL